MSTCYVQFHLVHLLSFTNEDKFQTPVLYYAHFKTGLKKQSFTKFYKHVVCEFRTAWPSAPDLGVWEASPRKTGHFGCLSRHVPWGGSLLNLPTL